MKETELAERLIVHAEGPRGLMLAVLASAIEDYRKGTVDQQEEAAAWFAGYPATITYRECADVLGFDRGWLYGMIRRLRAEEQRRNPGGTIARYFHCGHQRTFANTRFVENRQRMSKPRLELGQEIRFAYTSNMMLRGKVIMITKHRVIVEAMDGERRPIHLRWDQVPGTNVTRERERRAVCKSCYEAKREAARIAAGRVISATNGAAHNHHKGAMFPLWQADMRHDAAGGNHQ